MNRFARLQTNIPNVGKTLLLLCLVGILLLLTQASALAQVEDDKQHLLVLHSYHEGFSWTDNLMAGIDEVFAGTETEVEIHVEYMDTKRRLDEEYLEDLYLFYEEKYESIPVDAVLVSDNNALNFMRTYGQRLFPNVPLVFAGINNFSDELIADFDQVTGLVEDVDVGKTIDLMLSIHPDTEQIYVVHDQTPTSVAVSNELAEITPNYDDQVDFVILDNLTMDEIRDEVADLPPNSLILMLLVNRDANNQFFTNAEGMLLVSRAAEVPIYSVWDFFLGHGLTGGWLTSSIDQGRIAGEMAQRILQGEAAASIPIVRESPNRYLFDYNQLEKHNIALSQLPEESTIINQPISFYEQYKLHIWTAGLMILILALSVVVLSVNVAQRRQAEAALRDSYQRRGRQVELTTQVAQAVAAAADLDDLYHRVVAEVKDRFGYYHVQLLRYDPEADAVRLIAGAGEIGAQMERQGHQMPLGEGLIGRAAATGETIMRPDLADDPDWQSNPLLPQTRGEIAVPIKMGDVILGVLDVQSDEVNALNTDDQLLLEGLCGQIAVAIQNTQTRVELRRLGQAVEQSLEGLAIADLEGKLQFANLAWAEMHGYTVEEVIGRHLSVFHTEAQLQQDVQATNEKVMTTGEPQQAEIGHVHRDGSVFPTWMSVYLLRDQKGEPINLAAWAQDITERKEAEARILQEQQRLHTILESISVPILIAFPDSGEAAYINKPLAEVIGIPRDDLVGRVTPDYYVNLADRQKYLTTLRAEGAVDNMEIALKRANGERFWALISGRIIQYQDQPAILSTMIDVTARRKAQAAIARQAEEMSTVAEIGTAAAESTDAEQLLPEMTQLTKERFGLYHAHIYLLDEEEQLLQLMAGAGEVGEQMVAEGRSISLYQEQSLVARAARSGRGIRINDVTDEPDYLPHPLLPDTHAEMAVPMIVGERVIGVLDVQADEVDFFTEEDVNIYTTLAAQLAVSLQNARQYQETQNALQEVAWEVERLARLNEMSAAFSTATTVDEVYQIVGAQLRQLVQGDRSSVALLNEDGETFTVYALGGEADVLSAGTVLPLEDTAVGYTIRENRVLRFPGEYTLNDFMETRKLASQGLRSTISVPLMSGNQIIGTLNVASKEEDAYRQSDVNFLRQIVTLLANTLETRRLDERARLLASIVENHPDFIGVGTLQGEALYVNPAGLEMMQYPPDHSITQMDAGDFYPPADAEKLREEGIPTALETGDWMAEARLLRRDGTTLPVEEIVSVNHDAQGEPVSFSITMHDITERKATEAAQRRLTQQLEEQVRQLNTLQQAMARKGWQAFLTDRHRSLQGYAFTKQELQPITTDDLTTSSDAKHTGFDLAKTNRDGVASDGDAVLVPIEVQGQRIGVVGARTPSGEPIGKEEQAILKTISEQIAGTLERARLAEETQLALTEAEALSQLGARLNSAETYRDIINAATDTVRGRTNDTVSGTLMEIELDSEDEPEALIFLSAGRVEAETQAQRWPMEETNPNPAWLSGPVFVSNIETDSRLTEVEKHLYRQSGVQSAALLPLGLGGRWVGLLVLTWEEPVSFTSADERLYATMIDQLAVAMNSIQLLDNAQQRAKREQLLREVTARFSATVDAESVLQTATREIGRALGLQTFVYLKSPGGKQEAEHNPTTTVVGDGNGQGE